MAISIGAFFVCSKLLVGLGQAPEAIRFQGTPDHSGSQRWAELLHKIGNGTRAEIPGAKNWGPQTYLRWRLEFDDSLEALEELRRAGWVGAHCEEVCRPHVLRHIVAASSLLQAQNVTHEIEWRKSLLMGTALPFIRILPRGESSLNRVAAGISRRHGKVGLFYDPESLVSRDAFATFDDIRGIQTSSESIRSASSSDPALQHEIRHLYFNSLQKSTARQAPLWHAGEIKLSRPSRFRRANVGQVKPLRLPGAEDLAYDTYMSLEEIEIHFRQVMFGARKKSRAAFLEETGIAEKLAHRGVMIADAIDAVAREYAALERNAEEKVSRSGLYGTVLVHAVPYRVSLAALSNSGLPDRWCRIEFHFQSLAPETPIAFRLELKMFENWGLVRYRDAFPVSSGDLAERARKIRSESEARIQALQELTK